MIPTAIPTGRLTPDRMSRQANGTLQGLHKHSRFTIFDDFDNCDSTFPDNRLVKRATTANAIITAGTL